MIQNFKNCLTTPRQRPRRGGGPDKYQLPQSPSPGCLRQIKAFLNLESIGSGISPAGQIQNNIRNIVIPIETVIFRAVAVYHKLNMELDLKVSLGFMLLIDWDPATHPPPHPPAFGLLVNKDRRHLCICRCACTVWGRPMVWSGPRMPAH
jgi:hypothetical protein